MAKDPIQVIDNAFLEKLFPPGRDNEFFEALYGGAEEGAFDIRLKAEGFDNKASRLLLVFELKERAGKCMACSLTYGLPPVFERHPVINMAGMMKEIDKALSPDWRVSQWQLGTTTTMAPKVNIIPVTVELAPGP